LSQVNIRMTPLRREVEIYDPEICELIDKDVVLSINLEGSHDKKVSVVFSVYQAYRKRDESFASRTLSAISEAATPPEGFHWIYELSESEFLTWFKHETNGLFDRSSEKLNLRHYMILTISDIVDVIATIPPVISVLHE
jgi:hypothetical protein